MLRARDGRARAMGARDGGGDDGDARDVDRGGRTRRTGGRGANVLRQRARCDDEAIGDGARGGGAGRARAKDRARGREETIDAADDVRNGDVWTRKIRAERARGATRTIRRGVLERAGDVAVAPGGGVRGVRRRGERCVDHGGRCAMGLAADVVERFGEIRGAVAGRLDRDAVVGARRLRRDDEIVLRLAARAKECAGTEFDDITQRFAAFERYAGVSDQS